MTLPGPPVPSADAVRALNRELDLKILAIMDDVVLARLTELEQRPPGEEAWSAAIVLAHLGEFPRFFASDLRRFFADPREPVGRTHVHPERLAAVAAADGRTYEQLHGAVVEAFADLASALDELTDRHLSMSTDNRKYGAEPLMAYLDRYVIGHKRAHALQLASMPAMTLREEQS